ncbi:MAG: O-antigen polymerase [Planctomycetota bacterium]
MTTAPVRLRRPLRPSAPAKSSDRRARARAIAEMKEDARIQGILDLGDKIQMMIFWIAFAVTGAIYGSTPPTDFIYSLTLTTFAFAVAAVELWLLVMTKRSIFRARGFMFTGLFAVILAKPLVYGAKDIRLDVRTTLNGLMKAEVLVWLFYACVWTGYVYRGRKRSAAAKMLDEIVPHPPANLMFWMAVFCFTPELLRRWFLTDWTRVQSIWMAILGQEGAANFFRGQFGDWRVVFMPAGWLFELFPVVATVAFIKCRGRFELRAILAAMFLFVAVGRLLDWSRFRFAMVLFTPILFFFLCFSPKKYLRMYVISGLAFLIFVPLANLMVSGRSGQWFREGNFEMDVNATKVVEGNYPVLAHAVEVVPDLVPHKPWWELYYYIAINPIPRFLWKNKPWMDPDYLGKIRPHYAAMTLVGDMYIYGGWWHLMAAGFVFGLMIRSLDNFAQPMKPMDPDRAVLFLACGWIVLWANRSLQASIRFTYPVIALVIIMSVVRWVNGKRRARKRKLLSPIAMRRMRPIPVRSGTFD